MKQLIERFDRWFDARGDLRAVCLFRIFAGPLVIAHLWPYCQRALHGSYYRDSFYVPWFAHYPEPNLPLYAAMLALGVLNAAALSIGLWTRVTSRVCLAIVLYHFFLSETFFHHNRNFLLIFLAGLSLCECGDSLSIDALRRDRSRPAEPRALWPLWLWRAEACVPYLASSTSKLLDPEWFAGTVTWDRVERFRHLGDRVFPHAWVDLAASQWLHAALAKGAIALELSVGIGLWFARTRYLAVWLAVLFHVMVQLTASIQVFSVLGVCGLLIWTTPHTRERRVILRLDTAEGQWWERWLRRLDWLARFELVAAHSGTDDIAAHSRADDIAAHSRADGIAAHSRADGIVDEPLILLERDGECWTGRAARLRVLSRLPLTALLALPCIGFDLFRASEASRRSRMTTDAAASSAHAQ